MESPRRGTTGQSVSREAKASREPGDAKGRDLTEPFPAEAVGVSRPAVQGRQDLCGRLGNTLAEFCSVETSDFKDRKVELQSGDRVEFQNCHHPVPPLGVRFC